MDKPVTLAELRKHIEQRIQECRNEEPRVDTDETHCYAHRFARQELTEILALLDRVQVPDPQCQECNGKGYVLHFVESFPDEQKRRPCSKCLDLVHQK